MAGTNSRTKPDMISLMIIGAQKAGTTALLRLLEQHSEVAAHKPDEFTYFIRDEMFNRTFDVAFKDHYDIPSSKDKSIVAKSVGILESEKALQRLKDYNPTAKLVVQLRDPVDRAYSAFWFMKSVGTEQAENFEDIIFVDPKERFPGDEFRQRSCDYLGKGCYFKSLQVVEKYFSPDQILLLSFKDLKENPEKVANSVFDFMSLEKANLRVDTDRNKSAQIKYKWLASFFGGHNKNNLKQQFSKILPLSVKLKIRQSVKSFNQSSESIPPLNKELREKLNLYFKEENRLLDKHYKIKF